jgi:hypothetical protein
MWENDGPIAKSKGNEINDGDGEGVKREGNLWSGCQGMVCESQNW